MFGGVVGIDGSDDVGVRGVLVDGVWEVSRWSTKLGLMRDRFVALGVQGLC
jgi:hypothetical protein